MSIVYLNGQFLPASEAKITIFDGSFLHGAGLFETMRAENGRVFRLDAHLDRLCNSATALLHKVDREQLPSREIFEELLARNTLKNARVRMTFTAGSMLGSDDGLTQTPGICATASALDSYPEEMYGRGITVVICQYRLSPADPIAGHKTTAYLPRLLGLREAQAARCLEAIWFTTENRLAEGSISNVFVVKQGALQTPAVETPVLPGIARGIVLGLAAELGIPAQQRPMTIHDLLDADEAFLTNSIMQIMPVICVEKRQIANGQCGMLTQKLLAEYRKKVQAECSA